MEHATPLTLSSTESIHSLLVTLNWEPLEKQLLLQAGKSYEILVHELQNNKIPFFIYPLGGIPLDRDASIQLAAASVRIDERFYLHNTTDVKNLAFLDDKQTIYVSDENAKIYIKDINKKIQIESIEHAQLTNQDISIGSKNFFAVI